MSLLFLPENCNYTEMLVSYLCAVNELTNGIFFHYCPEKFGLTRLARIIHEQSLSPTATKIQESFFQKFNFPEASSGQAI